MALFFRRGSRWVSGYENSNNQKNRKRVVDDGKREKAGSLSSPIVPRALSFYFSPASPQHKEASAQERVIMDRIGLSLLWRRKRFLAGWKGQFVSRVDRLRLVFASLPCSMSTTNTFFSGPEQSMKSIIDGNR